jgi:hypothetical protein
MAHKKSRRMKHKASRRVSRRRMTRRRMNGGEAPVTYSLSGSWPSKMSMAQGGDFFKYHAGQHGGAAPVAQLGASLLAPGMAGPAMMGGLDRALAETAGMSDLPNQGGAPMAPQKVGGRRRKGKSSRRGKASRKANRKTNRRNNKRRGGALGFAPISAPGMLLSAGEYSQAGLNPGYRGAAVEYAMADARDRA